MSIVYNTNSWIFQHKLYLSKGYFIRSLWISVLIQHPISICNYLRNTNFTGEQVRSIYNYGRLIGTGLWCEAHLQFVELFARKNVESAPSLNKTNHSGHTHRLSKRKSSNCISSLTSNKTCKENQACLSCHVLAKTQCWLKKQWRNANNNFYTKKKRKEVLCLRETYYSAKFLILIFLLFTANLDRIITDR